MHPPPVGCSIFGVEDKVVLFALSSFWGMCGKKIENFPIIFI
jgi:hypothetical protein